MTSLLIRLPLPGSAAAYELSKITDPATSLSYLTQYNQSLMSTWLGRRVIVAVMEREKAALNTKQVEEIWMSTLAGASRADQVLSVWRALAQKGICLENKPSSEMWKVMVTAPKTMSYLRHFTHRVIMFLRLSLETVSFYFGIRTMGLFAARSFWDMQHRYDSLRRLISLLTAISLGLIQAAWITPALAKSMSISGLIPNLLLTTAIAFIGIAAVSLVFYGLQKLTQTPPLEVWRCNNLNHQAQTGLFEPLIGYDEAVLQLSKFLSSPQSSLITIRGKEGTGKTSLLKEFTRRLENDRLLSDLEKPQVFMIGSGSLKGSYSTTTTDLLESLKRQFEGFEKRIVLAFDEAHLLEKEAIESIKSWLDEGMRIVLITNSSDADLKELWGECTFASVFSHTRNSEIAIKGPFDKLLKAIIKRKLKQNPQLRLSKEAQTLLIERFKDIEGSPRALTKALELMVTESIQERDQIPQRIKLSNELVELEASLEAQRSACHWEKAESIAKSIVEKRNQRTEIETQVHSRQLIDTAYKSHLFKIQEITHLACQLAAGKPKAVWVEPLLGMIQHLLPNYEKMLREKRASTDISWNSDRVLPFCPQVSN